MSNIVENNPVTQNFFPQPIEDEHYKLGDGQLQAQVIFPDGHGWGPLLPIGEEQYKNGLETDNCPLYGTHHGFVPIGKKKYGASFQSDLSERYGGIMCGLNGHGGWPFNVIEIIRKDIGVIPEVYLPFDSSINTLQKYYSPNPMSYSLFKIGKHWLTKYRLGHDWVTYPGQTLTNDQRQAMMKVGLRYSPLGVAGYAWSLHDDGKYYSDGPAIHWFDVFDYVEGEYWLAFDSYAPYVKKLDWNYNFEYAMRYSLDRILGSDNTLDDSSQAPDCRLDYAFYLFKWIINKFKPA